MRVEDSLDRITNEVVAFVQEYSETYPDLPIKIKMISGKWSKRLKKLGIETATEFIRSRSEFIVVLDRKGGYEVTLRE